MVSSKPTITSHRATSLLQKPTPERFWIPNQTNAGDGGARLNYGGTPFRQPCPAYPSA